MTRVITHLELKDRQSRLVTITFNVENLPKIRKNSIDFNIKKLSSNIWVVSDSPFGRNSVEVLRFPIPHNVVIDGNAIKLSLGNLKNYNYYKELILNDEVWGTCIVFVNLIPTLQKDVITTKTTLKSFKEKPIVKNLWS